MISGSITLAWNILNNPLLPPVDSHAISVILGKLGLTLVRWHVRLDGGIIPGFSRLRLPSMICLMVEIDAFFVLRYWS